MKYRSWAGIHGPWFWSGNGPRFKKNAGPYSVRSEDSKFLLDLVRSFLTFQPEDGYSHRSRSVLGKMFNFRTTQHQRNQRNQKISHQLPPSGPWTRWWVDPWARGFQKNGNGPNRSENFRKYLVLVQAAPWFSQNCSVQIDSWLQCPLLLPVSFWNHFRFVDF